MKKKFSTLKISAIVLLSLLFSIILFNNDALAASQPIGSLKYPIGLKSEYIVKYEIDSDLYKGGSTRNISLVANDYITGDTAQSYVKSKNSSAKTATSETTWHVYKLTLKYYSSNKTNDAIQVNDIFKTYNLCNSKGTKLTPLDDEEYYLNNRNYLSSITVTPGNSVTFYYALLLNKSDGYPLMYTQNYFAPEVDYMNYMYFSLNPYKTNLNDICHTTSKVSTKTYTGKAVTPSFSLYYKIADGTSKKLVYGTDFTVQYGNRTKLGLGVIRFVGKGAFTGVKEQYFVIAPTSKNIKIDSLYRFGGTIKWSSFNGADGYNIYKYNSTTKKYSLIRKDWSLNRYTVSDLKSATVYKYMIKPYYNVKNSRTGTTTAKEFSSLTISFTTRPDYATLKKITKPAKKTAVIYWNKVTRVSGYQVVVAKDYKLKSVVKSYYTKGTSKKITGLTSGKWYYIAVRPYKNFNGKKVYSSNYAYYYTKIK